MPLPAPVTIATLVVMLGDSAKRQVPSFYLPHAESVLASFAALVRCRSSRSRGDTRAQRTPTRPMARSRGRNRAPDSSMGKGSNRLAGAPDSAAALPQRGRTAAGAQARARPLAARAAIRAIEAGARLRRV